MVNFLHTFNPQPIFFDFGILKIYWYGVFIALAMALGVFTASRLARRYGIKAQDIYDAGLAAIIGGLLGARLYAVLLEWRYYLAQPLEIVAVWHGGLAIHGGIIGAIVALVWYCRKKKLIFWNVLDASAPALALGQAIGRWGNYFNQEIFGTPTDVPWGIPIEPKNRPPQFMADAYFHPTFLYESLLNLLNFLVLLIARRWIKKPGQIFFLYLVNYALIRIAMEQLRTDPTPPIFGIRLPIVVSVVMIGIAGIGFVYSRTRTASVDTR